MPGNDGSREHQVILTGLWVIWSLVIGVQTARAAEPYSIEPAQLHAADLPQPVAGVLNAQGLRVFTYSNGLRMSICEVFWVSTVSTQDGPPAARYDNLNPGTLLGVIRFLSEAGDEYREDSHDQKLKAGYYTMRYAVLPGGDAGDFLLLSPLTVDRDPKAPPSTDQLVSQGRSASGTYRPALLRLVPKEEGNKDLSSIRMDDAGTCILQIKLHAKSNSGPRELTLAVILVNAIPEGDGS